MKKILVASLLLISIANVSTAKASEEIGTVYIDQNGITETGSNFHSWDKGFTKNVVVCGVKLTSISVVTYYVCTGLIGAATAACTGTVGAPVIAPACVTAAAGAAGVCGVSVDGLIAAIQKCF